MPGDALIFKAGVDASSVKQGMQEAANEIEKGSKQIADSGNKAAAGQQKLLKSSNRVAKQIVNVTSSFVSGASGADILATSVIGLEKSLRLPLGALAGLGVGIMVFEKMRESANDIKELNAGITEAIHPTSSADYSKLETLQAKLKQVKEQHDKLSDSSDGFAIKTIAAGVFNNASALLHGNFGDLRNYQDDISLREEQAKKLEQADAEARRNIAEKLGSAGNVEYTRQHGSAREYELAKIKSEFSEKIGEASNVTNGGGPEIVEQLKRQQALAEEAVKHRANLSRMSLEHQGSLLDIHTSGDQVETGTANENLKFANAELQEAKFHGSEEEQRAAEIKVKSAKEELEMAQRKEAISERERADAMEMANSTLNADSKHLIELQKQSAELQKQRASAKPDEAAALDVKIAQNNAAQREYAQSSIRRGFSISDTAIDSETGTGEGNHLEAMRRHLENARHYQDFLNLPGSNASAEDIVGQAAKVKQLENSIAEIEQHRKDSVDMARSEADIMQQEISGHHTVADVMRIQAEYGRQIAQAQRDKNFGLVEQLQRQQSLALHAASVDDIQKTPAQHRAERSNARHRAQAERVARDRENDAKGRASRGAHNLHRLGDHELGTRNAPVTATLDPATTAAIQQAIQIATQTLGLYGVPIPG